jgi:hypothetical protein
MTGPYPPTLQRGVALVLVLMLVVLMTIMTLAFFLSIQTETRSVRSGVSAQSSKQLADLAVQSVISQIQQATTQGVNVAWASQPGMIRCYDSMNNTGGTGTSGNAGTALAWYKLYSALNPILVTPIETLAAVQADLPTSSGNNGGGAGSGAWALPGSYNYGVFTDLNSPVYSSDGTLTYPIVNPSGATSITGASATTTVIGFDIATTSTPGYTAGATAGSNASPVNNPAAMPVRWVYILRNGMQIPGIASGTPGVVTVQGAGSTNPVVGRVAYWTDDETCKVNINTAAEGTYYDTPRFGSADIGPNSGQYFMDGSALAAESRTNVPWDQQDLLRIEDRQMGATPPLGNEYQRYIGHPAQTKLSLALNMLSGVSALNGVDKSNLFSDISPFFQWGGSFGGTQPYDTSKASTLLPPTRQTPYATLDEWMFNTQSNGGVRWANPGPSQGTNPGGTGPNSFPNPPLSAPLFTNTALQKLRFFVSANSDAPEVNLFGQPRISIWPISSDYNAVTNPASPYTSGYDRLIAQTASFVPAVTTGTATPYPYYFTRQNAGSTSIDWAGTGTGTTMGTSQATRNQSLFNYLRTFAGTPIPGYGGVFGLPAAGGALLGRSTNKYGTPEMDQILTEIFDYIRSTNSVDYLLPAAYNYSATAVSNTGVSSPYESASLLTGTMTTAENIFSYSGQVVPSILTPGTTGNNYTTKGFGRFFSIDGVSLDVTQIAPPDSKTHKIPIVGTIYLELNCPAMGYPDIDPHMRIVVQDYGSSPGTEDSTGTISLTLGGSNVFGPPDNGGGYTPKRTVYSAIPQIVGTSLYSGACDMSWTVTPGHSGTQGPYEWGGSTGIRPVFNHRRAPYRLQGTPTTSYTQTAIGPSQGYVYQLAGRPIFVTSGTKLSLTGSPLEILVYFANSAFPDPNYGEGFPGNPADLVQDIVVNFPSFSKLPLPTNSVLSGTTTVDTYNNPPGLDNNLYHAYTDESDGLDVIESSSGANDVVQSLVGGYNGDTRLIAAQARMNDAKTTVNTANSVYAAFVPHQYDNIASVTSANNGAVAHSLWEMFQEDGLQEVGFTPPGPGYLVPAASSIGTGGAIQFNNSTQSSGSPDFTGDWDNGWGIYPDGPYINKPDENGLQYGADAYYSNVKNTATTYALFSSPNRTLASPVMFGSLPTGVPIFDTTGSTTLATATPWQTLLFRPQPASAPAGLSAHPGSANGDAHWPSYGVEDELLLDWFWMPVVEPYSISTTFATAGKVNMNYQIAPFTYITRATALMSVLGSEYVISVPTTARSVYKSGAPSPSNLFRSPVKVLKTDNVTLDDDDGTLRQFKDRFNNGLIYKSAAEICDIFLEPSGDSASTYKTTDTGFAPIPVSWGAGGTSDASYIKAAQTYWFDNRLTGDNTRERPYNGLYPRLTTKSNTYTVHVRAQSLTAPSNLPAGEWIENPQLINSEWRGSVTVNRYLDPQDPNIPDFAPYSASNLLTHSLDNYYKYRILETRRFLP